MAGEVGVAVVGFGTVGSGVVEILLHRRRELKRRSGLDIVLRHIVDTDLKSPRPVKIPRGMLTDRVDEALADPHVSIVVQLIGGTTVARRLITRFIKAGKHVVTANKALLAHHGGEIFNEAHKHGVSVSFEASVAGGIPAILAVREGLVANRIESVVGIVNGTCNYILTQMSRRGRSYGDALADAQSRGYAEADPTLDVNGEDSAHKLAILARVAFGVDFPYSAIHCEGIRHVEAQDIRYADELGYAVKLLAIGKRSDSGLDLRVHPALISRDETLAHVGGVYNAVAVTGDCVGDLLFYGQGAGRMPTASAVCADVVDVASGRAQISFERAKGGAGKIRRARVRPIGQLRCRYYLRFMVVDRPGVLAKLAGVLGRHRISIQSVIQQDTGQSAVPLVITTHEAREASVTKALAEIKRLRIMRGKCVSLRVEG